MATYVFFVITVAPTSKTAMAATTTTATKILKAPKPATAEKIQRQLLVKISHSVDLT